MFLDRERNLVVYDTPDHAKITGVVPGAKHIVNGYVAAPVTLHNLQLLRWLGFPVPAPMDEASYDWPGRYKPFDSQRVTANFLAVHPRAFVLSDMGTGKTLAALWAADFLMRANPGMRALIVAPLSTLQRVWADAIFQNFLGRRRCIVLYGDAKKRRSLLAQPADFYIVNYDGVDVLRDALAQRADIRMCIVDEASAYRDRTTKRHGTARKVLANRDYLWLMTGTPTPNGPTDAYGLAKLVNNAFGESFTSYQSRVMTKVAMWKWVPTANAHVAANKLLQPSIRFAIKDCMDLPPCTTQQRDVELSHEQAKAYKELKKEAVLILKSGKPITAANEAVLRLKLIQIACGAVYGPDREVHRVDASPRIKVLREIIENSRRKVIVAAGLTSVLNLLYSDLKEDFSCAIVRGTSDDGPSVKERNEIISAFMGSNDPRILLVNPATMSHGLTLVEADTVVWYAPIDKTELYLQMNKRIDRPGQTVPTSVVQLAATPLEREIYRRLDHNETMQGLVLKLAKGEIE